uniref:Putative secreted protein n=1 Tax=Panstrongylus lignarius TaxID=156445 RepID=A0A224XPZ6_9HEMI
MPTNGPLCALYTCLALLAIFLPSILPQSQTLTHPSKLQLAIIVVSGSETNLEIGPEWPCKCDTRAGLNLQPGGDNGGLNPDSRHSLPFRSAPCSLSRCFNSLRSSKRHGAHLY